MFKGFNVQRNTLCFSCCRISTSTSAVCVFALTAMTVCLWHHILTDVLMAFFFKAQFLNTGFVHFFVGWTFSCFHKKKQRISFFNIRHWKTLSKNATFNSRLSVKRTLAYIQKTKRYLLPESFPGSVYADPPSRLGVSASAHRWCPGCSLRRKK